MTLPHLQLFSKAVKNLQSVCENTSEDLVDEATAFAAEIQEHFRTAVQHNKQLKADSSVIKQTLGLKHLELQNINYEILYLLKEIQNCQDTETIYQNIPLEDANEQVPDEHSLMIRRLQMELEERKRLVNQEKELLKSKEKLEKQVKKQKTEVEQIDKDINTFITSSIALQKKLGLSITETIQLDRSSKQLSPSLFQIYQLAQQHLQVFEKSIRITIEQEDDKSTIEELVDTDRDKTATIEKHPFHLHLAVLQSDGKSLFKLKFSFIESMNVVLVKPIFKEGSVRHILPAQLLTDLELVPNSANKIIQTKKEDLFVFGWLQAMSGLIQLEHSSFEQALVVLTERWEHLKRLDKDLEALVKGSLIKDCKIEKQENICIEGKLVKQDQLLQVTIPLGYPSSQANLILNGQQVQVDGELYESISKIVSGL